MGTSTSGYAVFWTGTSTVSGNSSFYWDNANKRLGIGTTTPSYKLAILGDLFVNTSSTLGTVISGTWNGSAIDFSSYTNASASSGIVFSGDSIVNNGVVSLTGTSNQVTVSSATGTITLSLPQNIATSSSPTFASTTLSNFTAGSIPFFGTSGILLQNNSNLYWDSANSRLGVGTTTPSFLLDVAGKVQLRGFSTSTTGLYVDGSGNVGIGTTNPGAALEINGLILAGSNILFGGSSNTIRPNVTRTGGSSNGTVIQSNTSSESDTEGGSRIDLYPVNTAGGAVSDGHVNIVAYGLGTGANANTIEFYTRSGANVVTPRMRIASNGLIGIGQTSPDEGKMEVKGGSVCVDTNSDNTASSCIANESDARLKKNIVQLSGSLDTIMKLRGVSFDWAVDDPEVLKHYPLIARFASSTHSLGLIAQDVQPILPEAIMQETVGDSEVQYFQLDYDKFIPHIIGAVQELNDKATGVYQGNGLEAGDLVKFSETGEIVKTAGSADEPAAGAVISFDAVSSSARVAFSGKTSVKVSNESGPIKKGDYLTSSSQPAVAMKSVQPGRVIGTALEDFDGLTGKIMVFVNPHWALGSLVDVEEESGPISQFAAAVRTGLKELGLFLENGVARLTEVIADKITAKEFATEKLCVGSVCVTESQFMAVFGGSGESRSADTATPSSEEETAQQPQETTVSETSVSSTPAENQPTESSQPESSVSEASSDSEPAAETSSITEETPLSSTDEMPVSESPASE